MVINRRERFGVLETEITESIEKLKEAIRLEKDLQKRKAERECIYIRHWETISHALKELQLRLEHVPTGAMKELQTTLGNDLKNFQDRLNMNLHEISTIQRKLEENGLSCCTERLAAQIREAIGVVQDGEMLEVEKMYQKSRGEIRVLEEKNQRNEAEIWKLRSENENLKAVMEKIRQNLDYEHSTDDRMQQSNGAR